MQGLRRAVAAGAIAASAPVPAANVQPASMDLRFGDVAYRLRASFLAHSSTVADALQQ